MTGRVYNRFKVLLAEMENRESRRISYEEIKDKTGVAASTLSKWATNTVRRYDADTIAALCDFLGEDDVGKLIVYDKGVTA
jgi:transcriptional regulator with XRE-family HTH domain